MLKDFTIANLLDLNETIARDLFERKHIHGKYYRRSEIHSETGTDLK